MFLVVLLCCLTSCAQRPHNPPTPSPSPEASPLLHQLGAYAIGPGLAQLRRASSAGITTIVGQTNRYSADYWRTVQSSRIQIIDSSPQQMIYQAACPSGPASCHRLSQGQQSRLAAALSRHARNMASKKSISAYYILDDNWTNLRSVMPGVYTALHSADPRRPTVCAFSLPIADGADGSTVADSITKFRNSLENYSPRWCDGVMIYSYVPAKSPGPATSAYDWRMTTTLPIALQDLRNLGWNPTTQPLIGVPQAFGYVPRTGVRQKTFAPEYRSQPPSTALSAQVSSFCANGAKSIVAYAWNDGSTGHVYELSNSQALREGLRRGARTCRQKYWRT